MSDVLEALDKLQYSVEVMCRQLMGVDITKTDNWGYIQTIRAKLVEDINDKVDDGG